MQPNAEFYVLGHLSKFVKPGARRVESSSWGTTDWNGRLMSVAFTNPDGSTALVVHNQSDDPKEFAVAMGSGVFEADLPGGALATYVWTTPTTRWTHGRRSRGMSRSRRPDPGTWAWSWMGT